MSLFQANREPSPTERRLFGLLLLVFCGLVGAVVLWRAGSWTAAIVLWALGGLFAAVYYALPPAQRLMYQGWIALFLPIGWLISHLALAIIYYFVFTPIGLAMRLCGYDPLARRLDRSATTYWAEHAVEEDATRYFRQF